MCGCLIQGLINMKEIVKLRKAKVRRQLCRHNTAHQLILGYSVQPQGI